ncbi:hypothetical protein H8E07_10445 [bacterium]|nr:hypothetical protein [bacterium]
MSRFSSTAALLLLLVAVVSPGFADGDLGPVVRAVSPPFSLDYTSSRTVGPMATIVLGGYVDGNPLVPPSRYRYMLVPALVDDAYIESEAQYAPLADELVVWSDPDWSPWLEWPETGSPMIDVTGLSICDDQDRLVHYLLALQGKDAFGNVSLGKEYALDVHNFHLDDTLAPTLTLRENDLGMYGDYTWLAWLERDLAQQQPLNFYWLATAASYGEEIAWYRWGWDLEDPDDANDPGWGVPPGLGPEHLFAPPMTFDSGAHVFTVECADTHGGRTRVQVLLDVIPWPPQEAKRPLLLIDDVQDVVSQAWPDQFGYNHYDNDVWRDARWLELIGNVPGFDPERDVIDNEELLGSWGLRDVMEYKVVIWASRYHPNSYIAQHFQPRGYEQPGGGHVLVPPYVWLDTYQRYGGNLLLVGSGAVFSFNSWPIFNAPRPHPLFYVAEGPDLVCGEFIWPVDFGDYVTWDGSSIPFGSLLHPYRSLGINVLDIAQPCAFYGHDDLFDGCILGVGNRLVKCVGPKALVIDGDFRDAYGVGAAIPEEVGTSRWIDWQDHQYDIPPLDLPWVFGQYDEFYDTDITGRPAIWSPRTRPDGGPMIEPMWRLRTRYDWILDQHLLSGDTDYPDFDPVEECGLGVFPGDTGWGSAARTLMDGAPIGFLSHATTTTKPGGVPDVVWGFDPTRFDGEDMRRALRWVLGEHFGLDVTVANEPPPPPGELLPSRTRLYPCRPNPFNPRTTLAFDLHRPGRVSLDIHDAAGRRVARLVDEPMPVGSHVVEWNGRGDDGRAVPSGVYFARLVAETVVETRRMLLLK